MPIKLTTKQYRAIGITIAVAAVSLFIGVKYFWRAFPEAAIQFRYTREGSLPLAERFLAERGVNIQNYRHAAIFDFDDQAKVYLERTQGLERMNRLTQGPVRLWHWSHRWFKPLQKEEFSVDVTPAGDVVGFDHAIPEDAPGASLEQPAARELAEKFLRETLKRDLNDLEFVEADSEKRPHRTDHTFTWKQKSVALGDGSYRLQVEVDGDQIAGYREFVKVPEQWTRDYEKLRSRNNAAQLVDELFWVLLTLAMVGYLIVRLRDRDVPLKLAVAFGLVGSALLFLGQLNNFSLAQFAYRTTDPYSGFLTNYFLRSVLTALGLGTWIFFLVASSEPAYRESYPRLTSFRRYFSWQGLRTRSFLMANVVGIGLTFFFFAYQTIFYLTANRLGAWAPADVNYSDLLNTRVPWVWVLFIGFMPAVTEELQFRAFSIPFLGKYLRSTTAGVVLSAFIWSFLHSAYPNQPFFIRGLEVGLGGIIIGVIMLRFGILATLIWHYSVDALYTAFLLLRSHNSYLMVSGAITAGIMLVPLVVALVAYLRAGTFTEEETLTNAREGVSRPERPAPVEGPLTPIAYRSLPASRAKVAAVLVVVFVGLAFIPADKFGQGVKVRVGRGAALQAADAYLREHDVDPARYRRNAMLRPNVDPLAVRYLLQRESIRETNQIYSQATRLALWEVRYFRPLEKEEHYVYVDVDDGKVFGYRHELDENAPGASLTPEQARALAEKSVQAEGYRLDDFELQNSEAEQKKAREDYTLTFQAKPGDPRNVDKAFYRLVVNIAGDQVVGFSRRFKLPEDWVRERQSSGVWRVLQIADWALVLMGLFAGALILFVRQLKSGAMQWRKSLIAGLVVAALMILLELDALPTLVAQYQTSIPWATYWLFIVVSFVVVPLFFGGLTWLIVALSTSLYPDAWRIFRGADRRAWRRDALIALAVCLALAAGLGQLQDWFTARFHAFALVGLDLAPGSFNTFLPGAVGFFDALRAALVFPAIAAVGIYILRRELERRAWWLVLGGLLVLIGLGPSSAHSLAEYFAGWLPNLVMLVVTIAVLVYFFRDNILAYVVAAFAMPLADAGVSMATTPALSLRLNGIAMLVAGALVLLWLFSAAAGSTGPAPGGTPAAQ